MTDLFADAETFGPPPRTDADVLLDELADLIVTHSESAARSHQKAIGPSEIGHPCSRHIAFKIMGEPKLHSTGDPLPSIVGTAAHTWLENAATAANARLGRTRWLTETRVEVRTGLSGSCDLIDLDTATVIDWKLPGASRMDHYRRHGPSPQYRAQAHAYGRGARRAGIDIQRVAICFLPRGGQLKHAHLWSEPYNDALVTDTLTRLDSITLLCADFDVQQHPDRYDLIPAQPGDCWLCPWHTRQATHSGAHCVGH